jgi:hypothetical protein
MSSQAADITIELFETVRRVSFLPVRVLAAGLLVGQLALASLGWLHGRLTSGLVAAATR